MSMSHSEKQAVRSICRVPRSGRPPPSYKHPQAPQVPNPGSGGLCRGDGGGGVLGWSLGLDVETALEVEVAHARQPGANTSNQDDLLVQVAWNAQKHSVTIFFCCIAN